MPKPVHEIVTPNVTVPTISVRKRKLEDGERNTVSIQWFGKARDPLPKDAQFIFESTLTPDSDAWFGHPEKFKVVFIGPVRDWPRPDAAQQVADMATKGNLDGHVVWMVSSHFAEHHPTAGMVPASIMTQAVLLGDDFYGVIYPVSYTGLDVLEEENKKAEEKMTLADRLAHDPSMKVPDDGIPWPDKYPACDVCESLKHSHSEKPVRPCGGSISDLTHVCPHCNRRWWQYNDYYHLWQQVTSPGEWDSIRRAHILRKAGYRTRED